MARFLGLALGFVFLASTAFAQNNSQILKAYGHLKDVPLKKCAKYKTKRSFAKELEHATVCGTPDHGDKEIATASVTRLVKTLGFDKTRCEHLKEMHRRAVAMEEAGRGSWPAGCHDDYPKHHAATYYVDVDTFPSHQKRAVKDSEWESLADAKVWGTLDEIKKKYGANGESMLEVALLLWEEASRRVGCAKIRTENERESNIHIYAENIPGSVIGYAYFNDGSCDDHVHHVIDSGYRPGLGSLTTLITHEGGHNDNLRHTFTNQSYHHGIMSYDKELPFLGFSTGEGDYDRPRDPSWDKLIDYFDGIDNPIPTDEPEPEPPTPNPPIPDDDLKVGQSFKLVLASGKTIAVKITAIEGDEPTPATFRQSLEKAFSEVEEYDDKADDATAIGLIYQATAKAIDNESFTFDAGKEAAEELTALILGDDKQRWPLDVLAKAAAVEDLETVAEVFLGGNLIDPEVKAIIELIVGLLPEGNLKRIAEIVLAVIEVIGGDNKTSYNPADIIKIAQKAMALPVVSFNQAANLCRHDRLTMPVIFHHGDTERVDSFIRQTVFDGWQQADFVVIDWTKQSKARRDFFNKHFGHSRDTVVTLLRNRKGKVIVGGWSKLHRNTNAFADWFASGKAYEKRKVATGRYSSARRCVT